MTRVALLLVLAATACKKDHPQCDRFVDLAFKCDGDLKTGSEDDRKSARLMMGSICEEAYRNDTSGVNGEAKQLVSEVYTETRERAECAAQATTCEQYATCAPASSTD
jgi:hypothetical protein